MAAQPRNIIVNVVSDSGDPLANAAVTLVAGSNPQVLPTDANGQCTFQALPPGSYRLLVAHERFNTRSMSVTHTDTADSAVRVEMREVDEVSAPARSAGFFRVLTGLQYLFLAVLAALFAVLLYKGLANENLDLSKTEHARGIITFVVAVVTVAIGLILVMGAAFMSGSKDLDKRFAFGKDVFTILVGVLGTVMGFYYGQATAGESSNNQGQTLQISAAQVDPPAPKIGSEFTLTAVISNGEGPYTYTVTFEPANSVTTPAVDVPSEDGSISHKFTLAATATAGTAIGFTITATDKNGLTGTSERGTLTPTASE